MANNTYVALDKKTIEIAAAYIEFTNIPATYSDLVIVANGNTDSATTTRLYVGNGSINTGTTDYSWTVLSGTGSAANSYRESSVAFTQNERYANWDATNNANTIIHLQNYSSTTTYKNWLSRGNNAAAGVDAIVGVWRNTPAIDTVRIACTNSGRTFSVGATFSLYGIRAEGLTPAPKATGGVISSDSTYMYHTFVSTGNFTPSQSLTCDYFIVAGGGGAGATTGGGWSGGGGGGGGYRTFSSVSFASGTAYTATIGGGGAGGSGSGGTGSVGTNTTLIGGAISTATSGGGGGGTSKENGNTQTNGTAGGSGGGAPQNTVAVSGGAGNSGGYTPVEGYAGYSYVSGDLGTGQGGGAGGVGVRGIYLTEYPFNGVTAFDGVPYSGGGGARWLTADLMNGVPNSGNGGRGANQSSGSGVPGQQGGSGVVILKYPDSRTITIGAGLTGTTAAPAGGFKVTTITAGTGNVSWA
jgi:hypothetical protein